jgi:predicted aconitase with swiveling domain
MSKFAIGAQAEHVVDGCRSATAVAVLCAVDESSGDAVEADSYGAGQPVTGARLTFTRARREAA